ncbi:hypothetical protein Agub_g4919 [Astrephomene gubernaculifera]|uniref:Uncharacterized protein n=1 Tax=Astrephomene gubernaculifera TaxID=47775 RepID=A0AAD3HKD7_9CHLO|nr:hypothetical protein Agub_g4919 [Astrephomene gubernaculifera]
MRQNVVGQRSAAQCTGQACPCAVRSATRAFRRTVYTRNETARRPVPEVRAVDTERIVDSIAVKTIEDLDTNYCDDFVCTSSPAVEQTVRSLARELTRGRYTTTSLYQPTVTYSDGFRSFSGPEGYLRQRWIADNVQQFRVTILRLRMLDKGTSQVTWRLEGRLGPGGGLQLSAQLTTTCTHNLLTGRITSLRESWDLSGSPPPAAALATLSRVAWSAQQSLQDAREGLGRAVGKLGGGGGGAEGAGDSGMPSDPTRVRQGRGGPKIYKRCKRGGCSLQGCLCARSAALPALPRAWYSSSSSSGSSFRALLLPILHRV